MTTSSYKATVTKISSPHQTYNLCHNQEQVIRHKKDQRTRTSLKILHYKQTCNLKIKYKHILLNVLQVQKYITSMSVIVSDLMLLLMCKSSPDLLDTLSKVTIMAKKLVKMELILITNELTDG